MASGCGAQVSRWPEGCPAGGAGGGNRVEPGSRGWGRGGNWPEGGLGAGRWGALVRGWLAGGSGSRTSVQGATQAWGRPASGTPAGFARVVAMCTGFSGIKMKNRTAKGNRTGVAVHTELDSRSDGKRHSPQMNYSEVESSILEFTKACSEETPRQRVKCPQSSD